MAAESPLNSLHILDNYRRHFMDAALWEPYVREVCRRHDFPCAIVRAGLAGTCPTFIVDDRCVVKFFGKLFDGGRSFEMERQANQLAAQDDQLPFPTVIASGRLFETPEMWPWPYLVFDFIDGISIGEVYEQVSLEDKVTAAQQLGSIIRRLHYLPVPNNPLLPPTWETYRRFLQAQRAQCYEFHRAEQTLPDHLIEQIDHFLPPVEDLIDTTQRPYMIHADLTADHLLGRVAQGRWTSLGLIDFGDAMIGDLAYELVALYLDCFRCDKRLLIAFLDSYGLDEAARQALPTKAMSMVLLHRFNVVKAIVDHCPQALQLPTLEQTALMVWGLEDGLD